MQQGTSQVSAISPCPQQANHGGQRGTLTKGPQSKYGANVFQEKRNSSDAGSEAYSERLCEGIIFVMGHKGCAALHVEAARNPHGGNWGNETGKHWTYLEDKCGLRRWEDWGDVRVMWWES